MSIKLLSAAWDLDIGSTEKMVLMCLCNFANDEGSNCWPSVATIGRKCSKGERTVQGAIQWLKLNGYLTVEETAGKSNRFQLNPRKICTPAETAPPQKTAKTPAESAPNPSGTVKSKNTEARAHVLPDCWEPKEFGPKTKSRAVVDGWPPGEVAAQVEHFTAHHRGKGNRMTDWQDAWSTWVLNSRRYGTRKNGKPSTDTDEIANPYARAVVARQAERTAAFG